MEKRELAENNLCCYEEGEMSRSDRRGLISFAQQTETNLFTYLPIHLFTSKKLAFTLAEVLITLGIIGVVAAMTMPVILNNIQKQQFVSKYKKVYSVLAQIYERARTDNGGYFEGQFGSGKDYVDLFLKYANVIETCSGEQYTATSSCHMFPYWHLDKLGGLHAAPGCSAFIKLSDGAVIGINDISLDCINDGELNSAIGCARMRVDLNGQKKPNTVGYDVFDFYFTKDGVLPRGHEKTDVSETAASGFGRGMTILRTGKITW